MKQLIFFITALLFGGATFCQGAAGPSIEELEQCFKKTKWLNNQSVEMDMKDRQIIVRSAMDSAEMKREDMLWGSARKIVEDIQQDLQTLPRPGSFVVVVSYFDKFKYVMADSWVFYAVLDNGKITEFKGQRVSVDSKYSGLSPSVINALKGFRLSKNQYLRPFCSRFDNDDQQTAYDAVCLVNIVDDFKSIIEANDKRQANELKQLVKGTGRFNWVIVRYALQTNATSKKDFTFPIRR